MKVFFKRIKRLWRREPAVFVGSIQAIATLVLAFAGIPLEVKAALIGLIAATAPLLIRAKVTPLKNGVNDGD